MAQPCSPTRRRAPTRIRTLSLFLSCSIVLAQIVRLASATATVEPQVPRAAERIRNEPESVWVEFIQLALEHKPLNLGQGFPDFAAPKYLVESLQNATRQPDEANILHHQYTRSFGHPRLVRALRDYYRRWRHFDRLQDEQSQVLITVGAYEALFTAIMAFVNPHDEVLIIEPAFDAYAPMVAMAGGTSLFVPLREPPGARPDREAVEGLSSGHFRLDVRELEALASNRTRVLILNTPNNPLGKVFTREELAALAELCVRRNLLVLADEVYDQFYYPPSEHLSIASLPGMWERTLTIGSAGKSFSVTGWKVGWAVGPAHLVRYCQLVHQTAVYTVATPLQEAIARAFEHEMGTPQPGAYWLELRGELERKRDRMASILRRAQLEPVVPQGGYFMMANFDKFARHFPGYELQEEGNPLGGDKLQNSTDHRPQTSDYRFARWLSRVKRLQGIPGGAFYSAEHKRLGAHLIRLCFIKSDATLDKLEAIVDQMML